MGTRRQVDVAFFVVWILGACALIVNRFLFDARARTKEDPRARRDTNGACLTVAHFADQYYT